ncbi:MAG: NUDIX hydrolase [Clostridiales bacterium]|nr:NUDIX hydrolase [Clostridiales bacterium]
MNLTEKTVEKKYIFKGKIINLRTDTALLPNGKTAQREIIEHRGGVCVLPLDEKKNVIFVRQFRYAYMKELLEIPAGKRDTEYEDPLECGKRELLEETGITAKEYVFLGELYPSPGYTDEVIYTYLARGLSYGESRPDEDEFLSFEKIPFEKAYEMVLNGEIKDAKTLSAILKAHALLEKENEREAK